jgi:ketosteroid isomerase-like protein
MAGEADGTSIVKSIYAAFAAGDVETALEHISETMKFSPRGTARRTGRGDTPYYGHQGVRQYFADAARSWDELRLHADTMYERAGEVVVHGRVTGVADGEPFAKHVVWVWQVRDGLAITMRVNDVG